MVEPKPMVDDYPAIRARMRDGTAQPAAPPWSASDRRRPGYERWVRETSGGDIDLEVRRLRKAGLL